MEQSSQVPLLAQARTLILELLFYLRHHSISHPCVSPHTLLPNRPAAASANQLQISQQQQQTDARVAEPYIVGMFCCSPRLPFPPESALAGSWAEEEGGLPRNYPKKHSGQPQGGGKGEGYAWRASRGGRVKGEMYA